MAGALGQRDRGHPEPGQLCAGDPMQAVVAIIAFLIIVAAVTVAKRRQISLGDDTPAVPESAAKVA